MLSDDRNTNGRDLAGLNSENHTEAPTQRLHRIRSVREQQGMSLRSVARRLHQSVSQLRQQENEGNDLLLTTLYRWQEALGVPVSELLVDQDEALSAPILARARLVRIMKTARSLRDSSHSPQLNRLSQRLIDQLVEIMPELEHIGAWQGTGHRRTLGEIGRIAEHPFPEQFFMDGTEV